MVRGQPRGFGWRDGESLRSGRGARRVRVVPVVIDRPRTEEDFKNALGRKVSLRYSLHGDPEHDVSEAVGYVQSVETDSSQQVLITIVNRRGEATVVPLADIQIAKRFPN
ncbi:MAG TPA: hypothetical protein VEV82_08100 [Actinomycetota bacterium]|nr:hypothetical protein [Actinomycetota bacterium]